MKIKQSNCKQVDYPAWTNGRPDGFLWEYVKDDVYCDDIKVDFNLNIPHEVGLWDFDGKTLVVEDMSSQNVDCTNLMVQRTLTAWNISAGNVNAKTMRVKEILDVDNIKVTRLEVGTMLLVRGEIDFETAKVLDEEIISITKMRNNDMRITWERRPSLEDIAKAVSRLPVVIETINITKLGVEFSWEV